MGRLITRTAIVWFTLAAGAFAQDFAEPAGFPEGSAEDVAMRAASKYLAHDDFTLRQEFMRGKIGSEAGKGVRLQLFTKTDYRVFFAVPADGLPKGAKLELRVVDRDGKVAATAKSKFRSTVAVLKFTPKKTGLYMVLMRIDASKPEEEVTEEIPYALFYGYK